MNGQSHDGSDLDLVLRAPGLQEVPIGPLTDFTEALHDSTLPFLVEARDWARLPERFHKEIEREYVVLVEPPSRAGNWPMVPLGDHVDSCLGKMLDQKKNRGELFPYLGNKNVRWGRFDTGELGQMRFEDHEHDRYGLKYGDLVVCEGGEPGRCAIWKDEMPGMKIQKALHRIRAREQLDNRFLHYWFLLAGRNGALEPYFTGTTIKHLTGKAITELQVPLPPKSEQNTIAHILGTLDDKIELNHRMNETLEAMARALFKSWFVDFEPVRAKMEGRWRASESLDGLPAHFYDLFPDRLVESELGEIPEGWGWSNIGAKAETKLGGTPSRKQFTFWSGNVPWINSGKANEFRVTFPSEYITTEGFERSATKLLPKRTTLVAITGATLGQVSLTEIETCANQSIVGVIGNEETPSEFLYFWITEHIGHLLASQTGAAQQHINKGNVNKLILLCPSSELMVSWVKIARPIFDQIAMACFENETLTQTRDHLLPKLMSGEIRFREAKKAIEVVA